MARTDAVQFFLDLAAEWRRLGAEVTFEPGWERRGNGQSAAYEGGIVHHTAFLSSFENPLPALGTLLNGRPGLTGPLCNVAGPVCQVDRPRLHVVAAFPANHAGASGGRSMGPLPITGLFNRVVVGLEIDYAGLTPMVGGQYRAALVFTRGLANVLQRSTEYIRAHAETSITGKWDPGFALNRTIDMSAFRRDAAYLVELEDFLSELAPHEQRRLYNMVMDALWDGQSGSAFYEKAQITKGIGRIESQLRGVVNSLPPAPAPSVTGSVTDPAFISALADELLAKMDARARDGDPATGPVS